MPDLLAAGRVAYDLLDYPRGESLFTRAYEAAGGGGKGDASRGDASTASQDEASVDRSAALVGLGRILQKRRDWDGSFERLRAAVEAHATPDALVALAQTLIRLGRTDEAISANEWAVRLNPYHDRSHYYLGNGYARRNYTQLGDAYPQAFADPAGRTEIERSRDGRPVATHDSRGRSVCTSTTRTGVSWPSCAANGRLVPMARTAAPCRITRWVNSWS